MKNIFSLIMRRAFVGLGALAVLGLTVWISSGNIKTTQAAAPCIVTIFGKQYDVAPLGIQHPGPKGTTLIDLGGSTFFQCGSDMTSVYQSQHGTDVSRMAAYAYVVPTNTPTPTATPPATPTPTAGSTVTPTPTTQPNVTPSVTPSVSPQPENHDEEKDDDLHDDEAEEIHENINTEIHEDDDNDEIKVRQEIHIDRGNDSKQSDDHDEEDED